MIYLNCNKDEDGNPIFSFSKRHGSWYGKPGFPVHTDSYDIYDYIGDDSIWFFTTLGLDISFLKENVEKWDQLDSYLAAEAAVKNKKVVNDSSERGVKITYDFLEQARKEDRF